MHTYRWISGPALGLYFVASHGVAAPLDVVIGEVAWAGTTVSTADEWIELRNNQSVAIDLNGWTLNATDGTPAIRLAGTIPAGGLYLLERTDDGSVPGVGADLPRPEASGPADMAGRLLGRLIARLAPDRTEDPRGPQGGPQTHLQKIDGQMGAQRHHPQYGADRDCRRGKHEKCQPAHGQ